MSDDTLARLVALATAKAREWNWPWDAASITVKRPLLGRAWRVSSYYAAEHVTATLIVNEKTGAVLPRGVVYRKPGAARKDWAFFARRIAFGAPAAALVYVIATRLADFSALLAVPIAVIAGFLAAVVSIRFEKLPVT